MNQRSPYHRMAIALLALVGMFDALYLLLERFIVSPILCPTGGGCETVAASEYAVLFGVLPVALLGVLGYVLIFILAIVSLQHDTIATLPVAALLVALAAGGVAFSLYLVYLQLAVILAICFWCMLSAAIQATILILALLNWHASQAMRVDSSRSLAL